MKTHNFYAHMGRGKPVRQGRSVGTPVKVLIKSKRWAKRPPYYDFLDKLREKNQ